MCGITVYKKNIGDENMKTAFISDTGVGLTPDEMMEYGIYTIPLQIIMDDKTLLEGEDISVKEIYEILSTGKLLKTSLGSMQRTQEVFLKLKEEGYTNVFAVPIASGLSGTLNMMRVCAEEVGLVFDYFDCHVAAFAQRRMILCAKAMDEDNKSIKEIKKVLNQICESTNTILVPSDLNHLQRSGRLTPLAAKLGSLLKIKPILVINKTTQGRLDVFSKVRTMKKVMQVILDDMLANVPDQGKDYVIGCVDADNAQVREEFLNLFKAHFPYAKFEVDALIGSIGVHTGIGCIGVQYYKEKF